MSRGSLYKRCGCTEIIDGKRRQLGNKCPKLRRGDGTWNPRHGTWTYATEGPGKSGRRKPIVRGGFETAKEAQQALDEMRTRIKHGVVVDDRLTVGRHLDEWLAAKGDIKTLEVPSKAMARWARQIPTLFPKGSETGHNTKATAAVWSDSAGFQKIAIELADASDKMAEFARAGDADGMAAQIKVVGAACGACHKTYRER